MHRLLPDAAIRCGQGMSLLSQNQGYFFIAVILKEAEGSTFANRLYTCEMFGIVAFVLYLRKMSQGGFRVDGTIRE